jgi:hypothetical protein
VYNTQRASNNRVARAIKLLPSFCGPDRIPAGIWRIELKDVPEKSYIYVDKYQEQENVVENAPRSGCERR